MFCDISNTKEYRLYLKARLSMRHYGDFQNTIKTTFPDLNRILNYEIFNVMTIKYFMSY